MPRRSTRASNLPLPANHPSPQPLQQDSAQENLLLLRKQWKWAAFSQFFYTFPQIFSLDDVTIADIERDLAYENNLVLPRVMQKLLYSLSYDRKVSVDNWQTALRKQYNKRDPQANPIGPEPEVKQIPKDDDQERRESAAKVVDEAVIGEDGHETETKVEESTSLEPAASTSPGPIASSRASQVPLNDEGEQQTSKNWFDLPMLEKLESIHTLIEWQFQNPTRLRNIMKSDDEFASWRIEPIGYDSKTNAYWFIGGDRLWIQRVPPKATKPKALKRKRNTEVKGKGKARSTPSSKSAPSKRARVETLSDKVAHDGEVTSFSGRHSRAAKDQAKLKLNIQAKQLADMQREVSQPTHNSSRTSSRLKSANPKPVLRAVGTRVSARLKGTQDDEWQPIPSEWLEEEVHHGKSSPQKTTGLESDCDAISDLTDLSDEGEDAESHPQSEKKLSDEQETHIVQEGYNGEKNEEAPQNPVDFVEWETICTTLYEWEHIAERFEKATHYNEKALYKLLVNDIVPFVTQELREIERRREAEEALAHRKRSSRIALKESEREEARLALKRKQEEDEKLSRARRMEARQQKEEAERIKRELSREQRRKEREAREESRKNPLSVKETSTDGRDKSPASNYDSAQPLSASKGNDKPNGVKQTKNRSHTRTRDDWELSCEICGRHGINLDDGTPMMSCGRCSKWQHISCHDQADRAAGRPRRNWDSVDFVCRACRAAQQAYTHRKDAQLSPTQHISLNYPPPQSHPLNLRTDYHSHHHTAVPTDHAQSYYSRPNGQHHSVAKEHVQQQSYYAANGSQINSAHYATPVNRPISFSHYQPVAHGFSSAPKPYTQSYSYYSQPNVQYRPPVAPSYSSQGAAAWNISTPENTHAIPLPPNPSSFRSQPLERQERSANEPSQSVVPQSSIPYYPSSHYREPNSYQPPLGR